MWGSGGGREVFYSPKIRSQSFSEPVPLHCELHMCFSVPSSVPWNGTGWPQGGGVGALEVRPWSGYFSFPGQLGSDKTPAGSTLVKQFLLKADLVKKNWMFWFTSKSFLQNSSSRRMVGKHVVVRFFFSIHCENLEEIQKVKLMNVWKPSMTRSLLSFQNSPHWASSNL